jgi:membrane protease YdiL (CAAX protease family)
MIAPIRIILTRIPDSWAWVRVDAPTRLLPIALVVALIEIGHRPPWLGISLGDRGWQIGFAVVVGPVLFAAAMYVKLLVARYRGFISVPADANDALFQAAFYVLNGPIEEALFRGVMQGGLSVAVPWAPVGIIVGTSFYVLYHHLAWPWLETAATLLIGLPVALAFALLPGPPSLLGVSIVHVAATCGFLGPGPYLLKKWGFVP